MHLNGRHAVAAGAPATATLIVTGDQQKNNNNCNLSPKELVADQPREHRDSGAGKLVVDDNNNNNSNNSANMSNLSNVSNQTNRVECANNSASWRHENDTKRATDASDKSDCLGHRLSDEDDENLWPEATAAAATPIAVAPGPSQTPRDHERYSAPPLISATNRDSNELVHRAAPPPPPAASMAGRGDQDDRRRCESRVSSSDNRDNAAATAAATTAAAVSRPPHANDNEEQDANAPASGAAGANNQRGEQNEHWTSGQVAQSNASGHSDNHDGPLETPLYSSLSFAPVASSLAPDLSLHPLGPYASHLGLICEPDQHHNSSNYHLPGAVAAVASPFYSPTSGAQSQQEASGGGAAYHQHHIDHHQHESHFLPLVDTNCSHCLSNETSGASTGGLFVPATPFSGSCPSSRLERRRESSLMCEDLERLAGNELNYHLASSAAFATTATAGHLLQSLESNTRGSGSIGAGLSVSVSHHHHHQWAPSDPMLVDDNDDATRSHGAVAVIPICGTTTSATATTTTTTTKTPTTTTTTTTTTATATDPHTKYQYFHQQQTYNNNHHHNQQQYTTNNHDNNQTFLIVGHHQLTENATQQQQLLSSDQYKHSQSQNHNHNQEPLRESTNTRQDYAGRHHPRPPTMAANDDSSHPSNHILYDQLLDPQLNQLVELGANQKTFATTDYHTPDPNYTSQQAPTNFYHHHHQNQDPAPSLIIYNNQSGDTNYVVARHDSGGQVIEYRPIDSLTSPVAYQYQQQQQQPMATPTATAAYGELYHHQQPQVAARFRPAGGLYPMSEQQQPTDINYCQQRALPAQPTTFNNATQMSIDPVDQQENSSSSNNNNKTYHLLGHATEAMAETTTPTVSTDTRGDHNDTSLMSFESQVIGEIIHHYPNDADPNSSTSTSSICHHHQNQPEDEQQRQQHRLQWSPPTGAACVRGQDLAPPADREWRSGQVDNQFNCHQPIVSDRYDPSAEFEWNLCATNANREQRWRHHQVNAGRQWAHAGAHEARDEETTNLGSVELDDGGDEEVEADSEPLAGTGCNGSAALGRNNDNNRSAGANRTTARTRARTTAAAAPGGKQTAPRLTRATPSSGSSRLPLGPGCAQTTIKRLREFLLRRQARRAIDVAGRPAATTKAAEQHGVIVNRQQQQSNHEFQQQQREQPQQQQPTATNQQQQIVARQARASANGQAAAVLVLAKGINCRPAQVDASTSSLLSVEPMDTNAPHDCGEQQQVMGNAVSPATVTSIAPADQQQRRRQLRRQQQSASWLTNSTQTPTGRRRSESSAMPAACAGGALHGYRRGSDSSLGSEPSGSESSSSSPSSSSPSSRLSTSTSIASTQISRGGKRRLRSRVIYLEAAPSPTSTTIQPTTIKTSPASAVSVLTQSITTPSQTTQAHIQLCGENNDKSVLKYGIQTRASKRRRQAALDDKRGSPPPPTGQNSGPASARSSLSSSSSSSASPPLGSATDLSGSPAGGGGPMPAPSCRADEISMECD